MSYLALQKLCQNVMAFAYLAVHIPAIFIYPHIQTLHKS